MKDSKMNFSNDFQIQSAAVLDFETIPKYIIPILYLSNPICSNNTLALHLLLFITRKYTIINANLKLINAKVHSFYSINSH